MSLSERIIGSIDACRRDLARVADDLKWAMEPGLSPAGRGLGAPRGSALKEDPEPPKCQFCHQEIVWCPPAGDEPGGWVTGAGKICPASPGPHEREDLLPGARFALDIGDHSVRTAFLKGVEHLAVAELRATFAVAEMHTEAIQPKPVRPDYATSFTLIDRCRAGIEQRLTLVERDLELVAAPDMKVVGYHLQGARFPDKPSARKALDLAVRALEKAMSRGVDEEGSAVKRCRICKIRPMATRERTDGGVTPNCGGRCNTCYQWFVRNKFERDPKIDNDMISEAKHAKQRRRARGEDWGIG